MLLEQDKSYPLFLVEQPLLFDMFIDQIVDPVMTLQFFVLHTEQLCLILGRQLIFRQIRNYNCTIASAAAIAENAITEYEIQL
ncbi:MAG TPA: hypothetical protein VKA91_11070 [Nitrososphaeraceae archaeon]|nr:hypothetical protein [Nitrososphaeraceae archaeon]